MFREITVAYDSSEGAQQAKVVRHAPCSVLIVR